MPVNKFNPQLIKGIIRNLKTLEGRHNFTMSRRGQVATGAGAAGAAVVGSYFSSSILATAAMGLQEKAVFFTCEVNGSLLSGCFNTLNIAEGEEVELVVDYNWNKTEGTVYAIRKPEQRCLWVVPTMEAGHHKVKLTALWFPLAILMYFLPFSLLFMIIVFFFMGGFSELIESLPIVFMGTLFGGGVAYLTMAFGLYVTFTPKAKLATKVIAALGYENPANTDIAFVSLQTTKAWEEKHGKPFPKEKYDDYAIFY